MTIYRKIDFGGSGRSFFRRGAGRGPSGAVPGDVLRALCRAMSFGRPKNTKAAPFRAGFLLSFVLMSIIWPSGQLFDFLGRQVCHTAFYTFLSHEMLQTLCLTADLFSTIAGLAKHFCIKPVNRRRMARGWRCVPVRRMARSGSPLRRVARAGDAFAKRAIQKK